MKVLLLLAVLVAAAFCESMDNGLPEYMESIRFQIDLKCKEENKKTIYKRVILPKRFEGLLGEGEMNVTALKDTCFSVTDQLAVIKHIHKRYSECDTIRQVHLIQMYDYKYQMFCLKGQHENCLNELYAKYGECEAEHLKAVNVFNTKQCEADIQKFEKCFFKKKFTTCEKESPLVVPFMKKLAKRVDTYIRKTENKSKHYLFCEKMLDLYMSYYEDQQ